MLLGDNMSYIDTAIALIKKHEGLRLHAYIDTVGATSIGYGRNLRDTGISEQEADFLLANDIDNWVISDAEQLFPCFDSLTDNRKVAIVDMMYNMGYTALEGFKVFRAAVINEQWSAAADAMLNSKWAKQTGNRAIEDANLMRIG